MNLAIFIYLVIIMLLFTFILRRNLHLFEIIFIWMIVWLITHSLSSILIENLELISISQKLDNFWLHVFKRLIFYPLIIIYFIYFFIGTKSKLKRCFIFILNILVMTFFEFQFIAIGVLIN